MCTKIDLQTYHRFEPSIIREQTPQGTIFFAFYLFIHLLLVEKDEYFRIDTRDEINILVVGDKILTWIWD